MKHKGFTLTEAIVAISIILVLAALSFPVFFSAKARSHVELCASNLRQIHLAVAMYQQNYDGDGVFGDMYAMGLPADYNVPELKLPKFYCNGAPNELVSSPMAAYLYRPLPTQLDRLPIPWAQYASEYREASILVSDMNHNPHDEPLMDSEFTHFGMSVRLSGELVRLRRPGKWWAWDWWH